MPVNFGGKLLKSGDKIRILAEIEGQVDCYSEETQEVAFRVQKMRGTLGGLNVEVTLSGVTGNDGIDVLMGTEGESVAIADLNLILQAKLAGKQKPSGKLVKKKASSNRRKK